jgi:hypothetical protein
MLTVPIFVTAPTCYDGPHLVHKHALARYIKNVYSADKLTEIKPDNNDGDVIIINATSTGAELLARAWCAQRGKNALIRKVGGPCYKCAVRAAKKSALGVGILIWVS